MQVTPAMASVLDELQEISDIVNLINHIYSPAKKRKAYRERIVADSEWNRSRPSQAVDCTS